MKSSLKGWKIRKDNKLRGAFGEADFNKRVIRINKKKHRKNANVKHMVRNRDGSENLAVTIQHEINHVRHPKMGERSVEKLARAMVSKMGPKQKQHLYSKVK